jgi:hypothetical protein
MALLDVRRGTVVNSETRHLAGRRYSPSYQAFKLMRWTFALIPLAAGFDKFTNLLCDWTKFTSPIISGFIDPRIFMRGAGVVEMIAGLLVAVKPSVGGTVVGLWLLGIVGNLLTIPGYFDIAVRDLGLAMGAFALAKLAVEHEKIVEPSTTTVRTTARTGPLPRL